MKVVIIGFGKIGRLRYEILNKLNGIDIIGVCDTDTENFKKVQLNAKTKTYNDYKILLNELKPDISFVCTINNIIPEIVCACISKDMHVFAEKPPGRNLNDVLLMEKYQKKYQKILKFGFNHRFHKSIREARSIINYDDSIGKIICARGVYGKQGSIDFSNEWRNNPEISGGGILIDQGIHMVDLMIYFLGNFTEIKSIKTHEGWGMSTEDNAFIIGKTENNCCFSIHSSAIYWRHIFNLDIICENGLISLNGLITPSGSYGEEAITIIRKDLNPELGLIGNPKERTYYFHEDNSWELEMEEFFDAITTKNENYYGNINDAKNVMTVIDTVYKQNKN